MGVSQHAARSEQQSLVPQSDLQRDVQQVLAELHESSVHLLAIGNKLRDVAASYEKLLSDLRDRNSNDPSKAACVSIRAQHSDVQNSEDTNRR